MARKVVSLDGDNWQLGQVMHWQSIDDVERWIPARVPGNVRASLLEANLIHDPFPGKQNELSKWVEDWNWWYKLEFEAERVARRTLLRFEGIDYKSHIFVNGRRVAENTGMFAPAIYDVTEILRNNNTLAVCIEYSGQFTDRKETLKCQMGFGWDFAPDMKTMGLWDSVSLIQTGEAYVRNMGITPIAVTDNYWEAEVALEIDSLSEMGATVDFELKPDNFKGKTQKNSFDLRIKPGISEHRFNIPMKNPHLWNMWEEGARNFYQLTATLKGLKETHDKITERFGVRSIELLENEGGREEWTFCINGKRKFIRGANWVPADSMPGRVTRDHYEKLLRMAKAANINLLRVWGGGLREKKDFYDLCDELGILVWQEFPFACPRGSDYPKTDDFRRLASKEAHGILDKLVNHPSVVMYCGGNEFSYSRNKRVVKRLDELVHKYGGGRPFKVSSPTRGESHNWKVFHMLANINDYRKEKCAFLSEFGLQAPPVRESINEFIPRENHWPIAPRMPYSILESSFNRVEHYDRIMRLLPADQNMRNSEVWTYHDAQFLKIFRYANCLEFDDLDSFIDASQKMQSLGLQTAIEHMRRRRFESSGVIFWQFNEPWPSICWSVVDYYLRPKLAYHMISKSYSPLLVSLDFKPGPFTTDQKLDVGVFLINDRHKRLKDLEIAVVLEDTRGKELDRRVFGSVETRPDSLQQLGMQQIMLSGDDGWFLKCEVRQKGKILSTNEYDLGVNDTKPTIKALMLGDWIAHNVLWK